MASTAPELIREAIDALMRADAPRLERLAQQVCTLAVPVGEGQRKTALAEQRALARLLSLTRRNLRLLGGDPASSRPYGAGCS